MPRPGVLKNPKSKIEVAPILALAEFQREGAAESAGDARAEQQNQLVQALQETIDVLARTKRSFKSKALGQLREKLLKLVEPIS